MSEQKHGNRRGGERRKGLADAAYYAWRSGQPRERGADRRARVSQESEPSGGVEVIAAERARQVAAEGFDAGHDDEHIEGEIAGAAACYAMLAQRQVSEGYVDKACTRRGERAAAVEASGPYQPWRWESDWWKPAPDPVRNLAKAGALIAAEIDRLQRARVVPLPEEPEGEPDPRRGESDGE